MIRGRLALLALLLAVPAAAQEAPRNCPRPEMTDAEALAVLESFSISDLANIDNTQSALQRAGDAAAAECVIRVWPSDAPPREAVRVAIGAATAFLRVAEARRSGNLADASVVPSLVTLIDYYDSLGPELGNDVWSAAQMAKFELQTSDLAREIYLLMEPADAATALGNVRIELGAALADPVLSSPKYRPKLLHWRARTYWLPVRLVGDGALALSAADYDLAAAAYIADGDRQSALQAAMESVDLQLLAGTPQAARDTFTRQAKRFEPTELRRRSVFERQAKIARGTEDAEALVEATRNWFEALEADLGAAKAPIWATGIDTTLQRLFLLAPALAAPPDVGEVFRRLAELARLSRTGGFSLTGFILPEQLLAPGHRPAPEPSAANIGEAATLDRLGVDAVVMPVWDGRAVDPVSMRALILDGTPPPTLDTLHWIHATRDGGAAGRIRLASSRVRANPQLLSLLEFGRGAASAIPAFVAALAGTNVPPDQAAALDAVKQQLAAAAVRDRAAGEVAFFAAFGRGIDEALGGRCAAETGEPIGGAIPRVLLILPASLDLFPMHLARAPNGRLLIDCYEFRRAPDLGTALRTAAARRGGEPIRSISGLWNPTGDLEMAAAERSLILAAAVPRKVEVRTAAGSAASVLRPEPAADVVHIAAHGRVGWLDPYRSGFSLAGGEIISLIDLLSGTETTAARLVVLSACEGGLTSPSFGEVSRFGIPSALLEAGAGGVVSTLWEVRDDAAALVMGRFYELLIGSGLPPAAALRQAQLWLRGQSADQLVDYLLAKEASAAEADQESLARLRAAVLRQARAAGEAAPYGDSLLWGGFAYFGTYGS